MCNKPIWWDGMKTMHVLPVLDRPWLVKLKFDYHPNVVDYVREVPGAVWDKPHKVWNFPVEMVGAVVDYAKLHRFSVNTSQLPLSHGLGLFGKAEDSLRPAGVHDHQWKAIRMGVPAPAWLYNDETGLGKGREVIESLKLKFCKTAIVVCPAQARLVWFNPKVRTGKHAGEFDKWWTNHPDVHVIEAGQKWDKLPAASIYVVSYEGLPRLLEWIQGYGAFKPDAIVFDEIHFLQNPTSLRSQACKSLVTMFPNAWRAGMTATLITNKPDTIAHPLNILFPGRYETSYKFASRYMNKITNEGGFNEFEGLNEDNADELTARLNVVSTRTTKREVAHLLPAFIVGLGWITPTKRVPMTHDWALGKFSEGAQKVCLLTHLRETAQELGRQKWDRDTLVVTITGEDSHQERAQKLQAARDAKKAVVCATLHSVNVAIDMTFCTVVGFAEIYSRPADMIQVLGRFSRLSGKENVEVTIFASEARDDGAEALAAKIEAINTVIKAGQSEHGLATALATLKGPDMTEEELSGLLSSIAEGYDPTITQSH